MSDSARRPNLLFLMTDQQQSGTLAPGSMCQMPNLEALAARGVRFENCYAPSPICAPARASLFTGLLPHNHGMVDNPHTVEAYRANLKDNLPFWTLDLQKAGYHCGYFGKWHIDRSLRLENFGFAEYETEEDSYRAYRAYRRQLNLPEKAPAPQQTTLVEQKGYKPFIISGLSPEAPEAALEHYLYSRGIQFIEQQAQRNTDQPWALVLSALAPHDPYITARQYFERYDPRAVQQPASFQDDLADRPMIYRRLQQVWKDLSWADFARISASYYGFCSMMDDQVGRALAALDRTSQAENTLVVFISDHGDYLGAHRLLLKGVPAFEQAYRVPLIISGPGLPSGKTVSQRVSQLDLAASILPLLGLSPENCVRSELPTLGRSLLPLLGDTPQDLAQQSAWSSQHFAECHGQRFFYTQRVLWWQEYKYVFNGFDQDEFYDLQSDPHELHNLAQETNLRPLIEEMAARMWKVMHTSQDTNMIEAEYGMFRFAPVGPRLTNLNK
jgi:arylsulfatase A-like enzyme